MPAATQSKVVLEEGWEDAEWRLPHGPNLPVLCKMRDGTQERRDKIDGDWRNVLFWKRVGEKMKK